MSLAVAAAARDLSRQLHASAPAGGSPRAQTYLGSPLPVLGLPVPRMRAILAAFRKDHRDLTAKEVNGLADALWRGTVLEEKALAISLLDRYAKILDDSSWRLLNRFVDACVGWGICDAIGGGPIAKMVRARPARFRDLQRWARSDNFWRRRVSLYALHDFVLAGDLDRPLEHLERLLYDEEFWVQRAVGTWLRECWKQDRRRTEAFLRGHVKSLPKVVITVATERAPKSFRDELRRKR